MADDDHLAYGDSPGHSRGIGSSLFAKVSNAVQDLQSGFERLAEPSQEHGQQGQHRFDSSFGTKEGNEVKWFVDGAGYFWAVSVALERARESIWILDCIIALGLIGRS